uniref:BPTI/Kunitz inhibitor domain-containing protein n=1 Tax=Macrostomum lignano TaxID=282301 RepID=A0A1I8FH92_9PLAT
MQGSSTDQNRTTSSELSSDENMKPQRRSQVSHPAAPRMRSDMLQQQREIIGLKGNAGFLLRGVIRLQLLLKFIARRDSDDDRPFSASAGSTAASRTPARAPGKRRRGERGPAAVAGAGLIPRPVGTAGGAAAVGATRRPVYRDVPVRAGPRPCCCGRAHVTEPGSSMWLLRLLLALLLAGLRLRRCVFPSLLAACCWPFAPCACFANRLLRLLPGCGTCATALTDYNSGAVKNTLLLRHWLELMALRAGRRSGTRGLKASLQSWTPPTPPQPACFLPVLPTRAETPDSVSPRSPADGTASEPTGCRRGHRSQSGSHSAFVAAASKAKPGRNCRYNLAALARCELQVISAEQPCPQQHGPARRPAYSQCREHRPRTSTDPTSPVRMDSTICCRADRPAISAEEQEMLCDDICMLCESCLKNSNGRSQPGVQLDMSPGSQRWQKLPCLCRGPLPARQLPGDGLLRLQRLAGRRPPDAPPELPGLLHRPARHPAARPPHLRPPGLHVLLPPPVCPCCSSPPSSPPSAFGRLTPNPVNITPDRSGRRHPAGVRCVRNLAAARPLRVRHRPAGRPTADQRRRQRRRRRRRLQQQRTRRRPLRRGGNGHRRTAAVAHCNPTTIILAPCRPCRRPPRIQQLPEPKAELSQPPAWLSSPAVELCADPLGKHQGPSRTRNAARPLVRRAALFTACLIISAGGSRAWFLAPDEAETPPSHQPTAATAADATPTANTAADAGKVQEASPEHRRIVEQNLLRLAQSTQAPEPDHVTKAYWPADQLPAWLPHQVRQQFELDNQESVRQRIGAKNATTQAAFEHVTRDYWRICPPAAQAGRGRAGHRNRRYMMRLAGIEESPCPRTTLATLQPTTERAAVAASEVRVASRRIESAELRQPQPSTEPRDAAANAAADASNEADIDCEVVGAAAAKCRQQLDWRNQPKCSSSRSKWTFDLVEMKCKWFAHYGCQLDNGNIFNSLTECQNYCVRASLTRCQVQKVHLYQSRCFLLEDAECRDRVMRNYSYILDIEMRRIIAENDVLLKCQPPVARCINTAPELAIQALSPRQPTYAAHLRPTASCPRTAASAPIKPCPPRPRCKFMVNFGCSRNQNYFNSLADCYNSCGLQRILNPERTSATSRISGRDGQMATQTTHATKSSMAKVARGGPDGEVGSPAAADPRLDVDADWTEIGAAGHRRCGGDAATGGGRGGRASSGGEVHSCKYLAPAAVSAAASLGPRSLTSLSSTRRLAYSVSMATVATAVDALEEGGSAPMRLRLPRNGGRPPRWLEREIRAMTATASAAARCCCGPAREEQLEEAPPQPDRTGALAELRLLMSATGGRLVAGGAGGG